jgi:hypothetical protein
VSSRNISTEYFPLESFSSQQKARLTRGDSTLETGQNRAKIELLRLAFSQNGATQENLMSNPWKFALIQEAAQVIASAAKQSKSHERFLDCFIGMARRSGRASLRELIVETTYCTRQTKG